MTLLLVAALVDVWSANAGSAMIVASDSASAARHMIAGSAEVLTTERERKLIFKCILWFW